MRQVWKYELKTTDEQVLMMPDGAQILTVQIQEITDIPCLWALVNPDANKVKRIIETFGTGNPVASGTRAYIGTYQKLKGALIFHVFERFTNQ